MQPLVFTMQTFGKDTQARITRRSLKLLGLRLFKHKRDLFTGLLALVIVDVLQLLVPKIIQWTIDSIASGQTTTYKLLLFAGSVVAVSFFMGICRLIWRYFIIGASHKVDRNLRQDLYDHLQKLPPQFYDRTKVGDIMAHASNDISAVRMATGIAALASFDAIFLVIASVSIMAGMNLTLTVVTLAPLPLLTFLVLKFGRMVHNRFREVQAAFSRLSERAQESFSGIRVVKAYGGGATEQHYFSQKANECASQNIRLARIWSFFDPAITGLAFLSMAILIGAGGRMVICGRLSLGEFVAFSSYLNLLLWPMLAIGWVINLLQRGTASMNRLQKLFASRPAIQGGTETRELAPSVEVKDLSFCYPQTETNVLERVSFSVPPGSTIAIAGRTGSGKTTIVELLSRLYDPPPGTVFLGGVDVHRMDLSKLRKHFGYVPQEAFLFAMSVSDNIAFGVDDLSRGEIESLARMVNLHDEITDFPDGYDTMVGERGISLSGGQKQRVAIARALALKPRILVLDDALSNVDTETESFIVSQLKERMGRTTSFVISHRTSAMKNADKIVVLEDATITESGTHEELIRKEGFYAELFRMQKLEEEAEGDGGFPGSDDAPRKEGT